VDICFFFILCKSHFRGETFLESKSVSVDFFLSTEKSNLKLLLVQEKLCDYFGWENCTNTNILDRGNSLFLLNECVESSTIYKDLKLIHREITKFQEIRVFDSVSMGRILCLDGMIQITEEREDSYTVDLPKSVVEKGNSYNEILIIGAGDFYIPTYLLKTFDQEIKKITVVEIDERVIEVTRKFFNFDDDLKDYIKKKGRLEIVIDDGAEYLKEKAEKKIKYLMELLLIILMFLKGQL